LFFKINDIFSKFLNYDINNINYKNKKIYNTNNNIFIIKIKNISNTNNNIFNINNNNKLTQVEVGRATILGPRALGTS
jgi:hypothetical protein